MFRKIVLLALIGICCASVFENGLKKFMPLRKGIHRFEQDVHEEVNKAKSDTGDYLLDKLRSSLLLKGMPLGDRRPESVLPLFGLQSPSGQSVEGERRKVTLKSFDFRNCTKKGAEKSLFVVRELSITPNPIAMPGDVTFQFDVNMKKDIESLMVSLELYKKFKSTWIKVPCLGQFGSCKYDVCTLLNEVMSCPSQLEEIGIKCKCPFRKGIYKEPGISAEIDGEVFVAGDYNVTGLMTSSGDFVGCYTAMISVVDG